MPTCSLAIVDGTHLCLLPPSRRAGGGRRERPRSATAAAAPRGGGGVAAAKRPRIDGDGNHDVIAVPALPLSFMRQRSFRASSSDVVVALGNFATLRLRAAELDDDADAASRRVVRATSLLARGGGSTPPRPVRVVARGDVDDGTVAPSDDGRCVEARLPCFAPDAEGHDSDGDREEGGVNVYGLRGEFSTSSSGRGIEARREPVGAVTVRGAGSRHATSRRCCRRA